MSTYFCEDCTKKLLQRNGVNAENIGDVTPVVISYDNIPNKSTDGGNIFDAALSTKQLYVGRLFMQGSLDLALFGVDHHVMTPLYIDCVFNYVNTPATPFYFIGKRFELKQ